MTDIEDAAITVIEGALRGIDRRHKPALLKALMRLSGNALAAMTGNDEAGGEHTRLGRQHFQGSGEMSCEQVLATFGAAFKPMTGEE